jgi:hypothetical protein
LTILTIFATINSYQVPEFIRNERRCLLHGCKKESKEKEEIVFSLLVNYFGWISGVIPEYQLIKWYSPSPFQFEHIIRAEKVRGILFASLQIVIRI